MLTRAVPLALVLSASVFAVQGTEPGVRFGHSLVYDGAGVVLVDGYTWVRAVSPVAPPEFTELWRWDGVRWSRLPGAGPASRTMGRAVYDAARRRVISYGGRVGREERPSSEVWEWHGETWTKVSDVAAGPNVHIEMAFDEARATPLRFGGALPEGAGKFLWPTETYAWDGAAWRIVSRVGPAGRAASQMVYDAQRQQVVLFGGQGAAPASGGPQPQYGDTWIWSGRDWREVTSLAPPPRAFHAMAFDARRGVALVYGGERNGEALGDMWAWDGSSWTELPMTGASPGRRRLHAMAYDSARDRTVLYGGVGPGPSGNVVGYADTWEWDGARWRRVAQ